MREWRNLPESPKVLLYAGGMKMVERSGVGKAILHQAEALKRNGIAYTFDETEEYDIVHINTIFPDSLRMSLKARAKGKKVIYYGHSTMEDFKNSFIGSNLAAPAFRWWIKKCYESGDVIITPTLYSKRLLQSYGITRRILPLSNGIDLSVYHKREEGRERFRARYGISDTEKVVIGVGHYIERKGILDFVEMAKRFPQYRFLWFGYTDLRLIPAKIRQAVRTSLPNLLFAGYVGQEELIDAYSGSDLFFFPTQEETEGIVLLEAMATRIPVLTRDIPIYREWLPNGLAVYKGREQEDFARLIPDILEGREPDLTETAFRLVQENAIENIGLDLMQVYYGLMAAPAPAKRKFFHMKGFQSVR